MGVPELLTLLSRAPGALEKVRQGVHHQFDYVLVDGTNVAQTSRTAAVVQLFSHIKVTKAVILCYDSKRSRDHTIREQRVLRQSANSDIAAQTFADSLNAQLKGSTPIFVSNTEGEADYKLLHIQRSLSLAAHATFQTAPSILIVSEDSDVVCGSLCGPAPLHTTVATRLQDTTEELCLLRLSYIQKWFTRENMIKPAAPEPEVVKSLASGSGVVTKFDEDEPEEEATPAIPAATTAANSLLIGQGFQGCLDFILMFVLLKGSGNVPPALQRATRIDMQTVSNLTFSSDRPLLTMNGSSLVMHGQQMVALLGAAHLSDVTSRPATDDECKVAEAYLQQVAGVMLRYVLPMRFSGVSHDALDTREAQIPATPSFAAILSVLSGKETMEFSASDLRKLFPKGDALREVELVRSVKLSKMGCMIMGEQRLPRAATAKALTEVAQTPIELVARRWIEMGLSSASALRSLSTQAKGAFSFELRRMTATTSTPGPAATNEVLAAAGLALSYGSVPKGSIEKAAADAILASKAAKEAKAERKVALALKAEKKSEKKAGKKRDREDGVEGAAAPAAGGADGEKTKKRLGKKERQAIAAAKAKAAGAETAAPAATPAAE